MVYKRKVLSYTTSKLKFLKNTVKRMKRQATNSEKIFANHISSKVFVPKYRQNSQNTRVRKQKPQFKKWAKDLADT